MKANTYSKISHVPALTGRYAGVANLSHNETIIHSMPSTLTDAM